MNILPHPTTPLSNCETGSYYAVLAGFGFTGTPRAGINSMYHQAHPILQILTLYFYFYLVGSIFESGMAVYTCDSSTWDRSVVSVRLTWATACYCFKTPHT